MKMRKTSVLQLYSQSSNTLAWPDKCSKIDLCLIQWADMPPPCTFMSTLPGYFCPLPQRAWLYVLYCMVIECLLFLHMQYIQKPWPRAGNLHI